MRKRENSIREQDTWLREVMQGYYNYHAIPGNMPAPETLQTEIARAWVHAIRRCSQRHRKNWNRFDKLDKR